MSRFNQTSMAQGISGILYKSLARKNEYSAWLSELVKRKKLEAPIFIQR